MKTGYPLYPIGILVLYLYFFTLLLSKLDVISKASHRKIWNVLLLFAFLATAVLGIFLVIQINYKFKFPFQDAILELHVDFGIAMAVTGIIHFIWHWSYYITLFQSGKSKISDSKIYNTEIERINLNIKIPFIANYIPFVLLGFITMIAQILLIREFMLVFGGNELIIAIVLVTWMILTGFGAYLGRFRVSAGKRSMPAYLNLLIVGWLPLITLCLLDYVRNIMINPGELPGIFLVSICAITLLLPFCFFSGYFFTRQVVQLSNKSENNAAQNAYTFESLGSLIAGMLFSFVLAYFLDNFQSACLLFIVSGLTVLWLYGRKIKVVCRIALIVLILCMIAGFYFLNGIYLPRHFLFRNQKLIFEKDSPYGNVAITKTADQLNFYENSVLMFTTENVAENEETVHYALIQEPKPENVLLVSGGISGTTLEVLKYKSVKNIDYIEIDPLIFSIGKKYTNSLNSSKIHLIRGDPPLILQKLKNKYDVVIMELSEPSTLQINRFYTVEFFNKIKASLNDSGVFSFSLPAAANYMNPAILQLNASLYSTCKSLFNNVLVIPGEKNYFIASDRTLKTNIGELIENKHINTDYVNQYYIDDFAFLQRIEQLQSQLSGKGEINRAFKPVAFYDYMNYWLSQFKINRLPANFTAIALLLLLFVVLVFARPAVSVIFIGGLSASALQIILMLAFQIIYGSLYQSIGAFAALFMGGLALGAMVQKKLNILQNSSIFVLLPVVIGSMSLVIPTIINLTNKVSQFPLMVYGIFFILILLISLITGIIFRISVGLGAKSQAIKTSSIYAADLYGSALGIIILLSVLIPVFGVLNSCYMIGIFNLFYAISLYARRVIID